jgi:hypothetical protein
MIRTLDFWLGNRLYGAWYAVFYAGLAAGVLLDGPELPGPLLIFTAVHAIVFLAAGGGTLATRLLCCAVVAALGLAAGPALLPALVLANLSALWMARHEAPPRAMLS